jgi:hypothetical protein
MKRFLPTAVLLSAFSLTLASNAQNEGNLPTQVLVNVDTKSGPPAAASDLMVSVNSHKEPLSAWSPVIPAGSQLAILIDDGLRESVGRELGNLRQFVGNLPSGVEVLIGYMQNGRVLQIQPFTTDHTQAAQSLRLPEGMPGISASPYFCLSDFVKRWPGADASQPALAAPTIVRDAPAPPTGKARFVLMISNGVDPYNGSTSLMNQDSPYVQNAITDAQRAGVAVYTIYYSDAGMRGPRDSFSGQSYLQQLSQATGGVGYFEGNGNPVSMQPFLKSFVNAMATTYIATFEAPAGKNDHDLVRLKFTGTSKAKLRAADAIRPGNIE